MLNYSIRKDDILSIHRSDLVPIKSYSINKLFNELNGDDEPNISENTVLLTEAGDDPLKLSKNSDLTIWVTFFEMDLTEYFITNKMRNLYRADSSTSNLLEARLALIKGKENEFVEKLNIKYRR